MFTSVKHVSTRRFTAVSLILSCLRFYITALVAAYPFRSKLQRSTLMLVANGKGEPLRSPANQSILFVPGDHGALFRDIGGP